MFLPTPPLSQHFVLSEKKELMLAEGRGRWAVSQKRIMVRTGYVASGGCTVQRLAKRFRSSYCAKVGEREQKKEWGGGGGEKRKYFPANPTMLWNAPWYFSVSSFLSFLSSFTQYSSLDRTRSLPRQRVSTYSPLKFLVKTFLFPRPRVFLDCKTVRIFAYSSTREQSNKRSQARALRARKTLTPRFTDFFTDFEKKNRLFCSLVFSRLVPLNPLL